MRITSIAMLAAIVAALLYFIIFLATRPAPTTAPVNPTAPNESGTVVCPPPSGAHPALWTRRGDPCPQVTATMTIGGEST